MKNNKLAFFTLILICLFSLNLFAQKAETAKTDSGKTCTGEKFVMPQTISVNNEIFADYLKVASLPIKERRALLSKQTDEKRANFIKVNLALQIVKRPNLTTDQKAFILDAISKVSVELYDKSSPEKIEQSNQIGLDIESRALKLFSYEEVGDFIEPMMAKKDEEVRLLQKYEKLLENSIQIRKDIVKKLPIKDKVDIWKTQLAYHIATSTLTKKQVEFIANIMPNIQTIIEDSINLSGEDREKYVENLESSMFNLFTKAEAYSIFMTVGIQNRKTDNLDLLNRSKNLSNNNYTIQDSIKLKTEQSLFPTIQNAQTCNCRWYCDLFGYSCNSYYCNSTQNGCGPFETWSCMKICTDDEDA